MKFSARNSFCTYTTAVIFECISIYLCLSQLDDVDEPTRAIGTDTPSLIDLILTNEEHQVNNLAYLAPLDKSDHNVLLFTFDCYFETEPISAKYNYHKADYEAMKGDLENSECSGELGRV